MQAFTIFVISTNALNGNFLMTLFGIRSSPGDFLDLSNRTNFFTSTGVDKKGAMSSAYNFELVIVLMERLTSLVVEG